MAHPQEGELAPFLVLNLNGIEGKFRAFRKANQWALMQSAQADRSRKMSEAMAANYNVAMTSVMPSDRDAFNAYMMENGYVENLEEQLFDALGKLWSGETMLPLERESIDGSASTSTTNSESMQNSSEPESEFGEPQSQPILIEESGSSSPV